MNFDKIKKQSTSLIFNRSLIAMFSFVLEIVFIKYLTPTEKGEFFYIRNNIELFAFLFSLGLGTSIVYFRSTYGDKYDRQILNWIVISFFLLFGFSIFFYNIDLLVKYLFISKEYFFYGVIASALVLFSLYLQKILLSDDNIKEFNKLIFSVKIVAYLSLILLSVILVDNKVFYLLISLIISLFVVNIYFIPKIKLNVKSKSKNKKFFSYSLKAYIYEVIFHLRVRLDNFLILHYFGVDTVGLYSVAVNFGAVAQLIFSSVALILFKEMSKSTNFRMFKKIVLIYSTLIFIVLVISYFILYFSVKIFGRDKFEEAINIFIPYSISLYIFSLIVLLQVFFNSRGNTNVQLYAILLGLIPYIFIPLFGINSIYELIVVIIISNLINLLYLFLRFRRENA